MRAKIAKWGNSLAVRLPRGVAAEAGLVEGQEIEINADNGEVHLRPAVKQPRYTLSELVAEMKRLGPENEPPFEDWGPDVGAEIIDDGGWEPPDDEPDDASRGR